VPAVPVPPGWDEPEADEDPEPALEGGVALELELEPGDPVEDPLSEPLIDPDGLDERSVEELEDEDPGELERSLVVRSVVDELDDAPVPAPALLLPRS
jgi:hypothetical protein